MPTVLQPPLRAAALYEQLRTEAYSEIATNVLRTLSEAGVPFLATRGVVFAQSLYRNGGLRHCHDIDLVVPVSGLNATAELLVASCGFKQPVAEDRLATGLVLFHPSGLPLALHTQGGAVPPLQLSWNRMNSHRTTIEAYGSQCPTPSSELALLQVFLQGPFGPQRDSLVWVCDACKLVQQGQVDWQAFAGAVTGPAELLLSIVLLEYMSSQLNAGVPVSTTAALRHRWSTLARSQKRSAENTLLFALLRPGSLARNGIWQKAGAPRARLRALRMMLFPAVETLRSAGQIADAAEATRFWLRQVWRGFRHAFASCNTPAALGSGFKPETSLRADRQAAAERDKTAG